MRDEAGFPQGELIDGRYRVEGVLGRGGMGAVLRAHDVGRGQPVAVKVLAAEVAVRDDALARFQREAEVAARVDGAGGVVRVWSAGRHRGRAFIVMELVEGEELGKLFARGAPPETVARLLATVARTIGRCHAAGVVHRDLKPSNVLVRAHDGQPLVADFGLAFAGDAQRLTRTGDLLGTPVYMAPEQAEDATRAVDGRVDVYALGALLYEGLAGRPPFAGNLINVLKKLLTEDPPALSSVRPGVPTALEAVCRRAMAKAPAARYPSAAALADDLERWLVGAAVQGDRARRRARVGVIVLALVAVALLVAVGLQVRRRLVGGSRRALVAAQAWRAQVLEPWAYDAGDGAPPRLADLDAQASALTAARRWLPAEESAVAADLLRWIEAGRRVVASSRRRRRPRRCRATPTG